jgi:hypothetical protein
LLSILVIVPLLLGLIAESDLVDAPDPRLSRCLTYHPPAALLALFGLLSPIGFVSGALVVPWFVFTGVLGICGVRRLEWSIRRRPLHLCISASLAYLPVGAAWLCLARFGVDPMGFGEPLVVLTAVHFHYAGFALPILSGFAARRCDAQGMAVRRWAALLCCGAMLGVPLTAAGISVSPVVEMFAVAIVAATVVGLSVLTLAKVMPTAQSRSAWGLLCLSAVSAWFPIALAVVYALGELTERSLVEIPRMVATHGWVNALGFVLAGALGWALLERANTNLSLEGEE